MVYVSSYYSDYRPAPRCPSVSAHPKLATYVSSYYGVYIIYVSSYYSHYRPTPRCPKLAVCLSSHYSSDCPHTNITKTCYVCVIILQVASVLILLILRFIYVTSYYCICIYPHTTVYKCVLILVTLPASPLPIQSKCPHTTVYKCVLILVILPASPLPIQSKYVS
jgi:hypothetical protein